jgi:hypothetical protein
LTGDDETKGAFNGMQHKDRLSEKVIAARVCHRSGWAVDASDARQEVFQNIVVSIAKFVFDVRSK